MSISIMIMEVSFRICREFVAKEVAMYNTINHLDAVILPNLATKVWNIALLCIVRFYMHHHLSVCLSVCLSRPQGCCWLLGAFQ